MIVVVRCLARATVLSSIALLFGCRPAGRGSTPPTPAPHGDPDDAAAREAKDAPGEILKAVIPLIDGGAIDIETLHGAPVVLALAMTGDDAFAPTRDMLAGLVERHPEGVRVVVVAMDADADVVPRAWPGGPEAVVLGWDPQGALATRLQVRTLPTVFVLDRDGRIAIVKGGADAAALSDVSRAAEATVAG